MSKDRGPWQLGRRAWERLDGWHLDGRSASASGNSSSKRGPGPADDGDGALAALADVGFVRHLLDQAELVAVRTARQHGKSWAEIAVKLGVTRQSAWERWRELDDAASPTSESTANVVDGVIAQAVAGMAEEASATPAEVLERTARDLRRRSNMRVPNVLGMSWDDARVALAKVSLMAVGPDADGAAMEAISWPDAKVVDQSPESGARVPAGTSVTLWVMRGGGSAGVREPRRPLPGPQSAREMRYESDEAVG